MMECVCEKAIQNTYVSQGINLENVIEQKHFSPKINCSFWVTQHVLLHISYAKIT